ncbi:hypothetical protein C1H46_044633 [Malus baccata]|uniref:Uncharacterized protein n=1 Tax=Malus baccata TaxID=106549 RepID=A0A540K6I3_MALBA|nr:hypothetical protein C1H46_044633 [Malus baccata]
MRNLSAQIHQEWCMTSSGDHQCPYLSTNAYAAKGFCFQHQASLGNEDMILRKCFEDSLAPIAISCYGMIKSQIPCLI